MDGTKIVKKSRAALITNAQRILLESVTEAAVRAALCELLLCPDETGGTELRCAEALLALSKRDVRLSHALAESACLDARERL